jgi:hypothetical protein
MGLATSILDDVPMINIKGKVLQRRRADRNRWLAQSLREARLVKDIRLGLRKVGHHGYGVADHLLESQHDVAHVLFLIDTTAHSTNGFGRGGHSDEEGVFVLPRKWHGREDRLLG